MSAAPPAPRMRRDIAWNFGALAATAGAGGIITMMIAAGMGAGALATIVGGLAMKKVAFACALLVVLSLGIPIAFDGSLRAGVARIAMPLAASVGRSRR